MTAKAQSNIWRTEVRHYVGRDVSREVQRHGEARDKRGLFAPLIR